VGAADGGRQGPQQAAKIFASLIEQPLPQVHNFRKNCDRMNRN
jgi:hypothetical protein